MTVSDKDFIVKNGIAVDGTASFNSDFILNNIPLSINQETNRLQAYINNKWVQMALSTDIIPANLSGMNLNINYGGGN